MTVRARVRSALAGLLALVRPRRGELELDAELRAFIRAATDDRIADGAEPAAARRAAHLALGNATAIKEDTRGVGWEHHVEMAWQDTRYAARTLRRTPGFTLTVLLTLALGIGGNAAILGLINTLYFAVLPIPSPDRVLRLNDSAPGAGGERRLFGMHSQNVVEVLGRDDLFAAAAAAFGEDLTITGDDPPERVTVISRTAGWRDTLGVVPVKGRDFTGDEERRGRQSGVALVSDALWTRRFAGRQPGSAVLRLDGRPFTVVGVMPEGFRFPYDADVWVPHVVNAADHARDYAVFARMKNGRTLPQVRAAMDVVSAGLRARYRDELPGYAVNARTLRDNLISNEAGTSLALLSLVGFLLLLACVNVATLLLARSVARTKEFTVRTVLGASRARQVRQAMTEALLLASIGGACGLALAAWLSPATSTLIPENIAVQLGVATPRMDWRVLAATAVLAIAAALACGLPPLFGPHARAALTLREGGRGSIADAPRSRRLLNLLVCGQIALALVLLSGAAAMLQNLYALQHRNLGVRTAGLLTMTLTPSPLKYPDGNARAGIARRVTAEVQTLPGIESAGITTVNPFGGANWGASVILEGRDTGRPVDAVQVNHRLVTPGTFAAMGMSLLRGRDFTWHDDAGAPRVAVISARMAAELWPGEIAIGKRLRVARPGQPWTTVIGVAADVADARDPADPDLTWYLPYLQQADTPAAIDLHLMIRTPGDVAAAVRSRLAAVDPDLAPYDVARMDEYYARTLDRDRLGAVLMTTFGLFGLVLAILGVYSVMAFAVAQRRAEIGVRMALGAGRSAIMTFVFGSAARIAAVGLLLGGGGSAAARRGLSSMLPALPPGDAVVPLACAAMLLTAVLIACYVPARRAARIDPLDALRRG